MRLIIGMVLCLALTACTYSQMKSKTVAAEDVAPLHSLLVFVESAYPENAKDTEQVVAKRLTEAGIVVQLGTAQLSHTAAANEVIDKAQQLAVDGVLIVTVEWLEQKRTDKGRPAPIVELLGLDDRQYEMLGRYAARLYDVRAKDKHTKLWQAKLDTKGGGMTTADQIVNDVSGRIVTDLKSKDFIAAAQK